MLPFATGNFVGSTAISNVFVSFGLIVMMSSGGRIHAAFVLNAPSTTPAPLFVTLSESLGFALAGGTRLDDGALFVEAGSTGTVSRYLDGAGFGGAVGRLLKVISCTGISRSPSGGRLTVIFPVSFPGTEPLGPIRNVINVDDSFAIVTLAGVTVQIVGVAEVRQAEREGEVISNSLDQGQLVLRRLDVRPRSVDRDQSDEQRRSAQEIAA